MRHSASKKHTVLTWMVGQKGVFFWCFDDPFYFQGMVNFQEKNKTGFLPDAVFSTGLPCRLGDILIPDFSYKTGPRESAWFMGCFSAGAFFIRKGQLFLSRGGEFHYQCESEGFQYRHFTIAPLQKHTDRESLRLKFLSGC